jgi:hypothetical protein
MFRAACKTVDELVMLVTAALAGDPPSIALINAGATRAPKLRIVYPLIVMTLPP